MTAAVQAPASTGAAAELRRDHTSVRVSITNGAPLTSFCLGGTDWCVAGPWFDYAPTQSSCSLPSFVAGAPRAPFPEGGILRTETPVVDVHADGAAGSITATWAPSTYPLSWTRTVTLESDALLLQYAVSNPAATRLPFVWGLGIPLAWDSGSGIDLPRAARARVAMARGGGLPQAGSEFAWPALRDGGKLVDLARPSQLRPLTAVHCFVELSRGRLVIRSGKAALEISGDPASVTHAHLQVNNDAPVSTDAPRRWWHRREARRHIVTGPAIGATAALSDAVGGWNSARWIDPGETLRWTIRCHACTDTL